MRQEHPAVRGRSNATVLCDTEGVEAARAWLRQRIDDSTRAPLDPRYVEAFNDVCDSWKVSP